MISMDHKAEEPAPTSPTVNSPLPIDGLLPIPTADPPFDKKTADLILQTSDNVAFHVWKCILAEASPVFDDMFVLGQPQHGQQSRADTTDSKGAESSPFHPPISVIEVPEDCATLRLLLRWIYPPSHHSRPSGKFELKLELKDLKPVLAAAHKYKMDGVVLEITNILINDCRKMGPVRVYAIGDRYNLPEVIQAAARSFLSLSTSAANAYVEELEDISGGAYQRLCEYRRQCVATLVEMTKDLTWLANGGWTFKRTSASCTCVADLVGTKYRFKGVDTEYVLSAWFTGHCQRMASQLQDRPGLEATADEREELCELALKEASKCLHCREVVHNHMRIFTIRWKREIVRRISAISLKLN